MKGDARTAGVLALSSSLIEGEARSNSPPLSLPSFALALFDPGARTVCRDLGERFDEGRLSGGARREGSLQVGGDLTLDHALLYVNGNLTVQGGVRGRGAIVVRGNVRIGGASAVEATDAAALMADGDITISGNGIFQGLVYCRGAFTADHVTIVGSLIQNSPTSQAVSLDQVQLYFCAAGAEVKLFVPGSMLFSDASTEFWSQTSMTDTGRGPWTDAPTSQPGQASEPAPTISSLASPPGNLSGQDLTDYLHVHSLLTVTRRDGRLIYTTLRRGRTMDGEGDVPAERRLIANSPWAGYSTTEMPGQVISIYESVDLDSLITEWRSHWAWWEAAHHRSTSEQAWQEHKQQITDRVSALSESVGPADRAQQVTFSINPSRFLSPADRMRLLYWGDL